MPASLLRLGGWRSVGALVVVAAAARNWPDRRRSCAAGKGRPDPAAGRYTALSFRSPAKPVVTRRAGERRATRCGSPSRTLNPGRMATAGPCSWSSARASRSAAVRTATSGPGKRPRFLEPESSPVNGTVLWNLLSSWLGRVRVRRSMPGPSAAGPGAELVGQRPVVALVCDVIYPYSPRRQGTAQPGTAAPAGRPGRRARLHHAAGGPARAVRRDSGSATTPSRRCTRCTGTAAARSARRSGSRWPACACWAAGSTCWRPTRSPTSSCSCCAWWLRSSGSRFTVTWHEVWNRDYWREYLGLAGWAAWFSGAAGHAAARHDHRRVAADRGRLRAMLGARSPITTVPNGIDLAAIRAAYPDADPTDLVVVGRLIGAQAGRHGARRRCPAARPGRPATCRIIGDGPERAALGQQAQALGIALTRWSSAPTSASRKRSTR